jgi:hypothetical protein
MAKQLLTITIEPEVLKKFRDYCEERKLKMSQEISRLIEMETKTKIDGDENGVNKE